jgi:glucose dehydrogenase
MHTPMTSIHSLCASVPLCRRRSRIRRLTLAGAAVFASLASLAVTLDAQVSFERLLNAEREPHNWLSYSGTLDNQRYSRLTQITPAYVKGLHLAWVWQNRSLE